VSGQLIVEQIAVELQEQGVLVNVLLVLLVREDLIFNAELKKKRDITLSHSHTHTLSLSFFLT
jgi:hypothetical protein